MSKLFQPCLRGHQAAGLINDECDGFCHAKSYINEKEHWSYFIQNLERILLSTAIDKTLRPDHRPLQTSGVQKNAAGLALPEQKAGFGCGSGAQSKQSVHGSDFWQQAALRSTGSSWRQTMDWFLQSKYKEQVYPFIPGTVLERSLRLKVSR